MLRNFLSRVNLLDGRKLVVIPRANHFICLLPEVLDVAIENNYLLRFVERNEPPQYQKLTDEQCYEGTTKLALDFEYWLHHHLTENAEKPGTSKTFDNLCEPIELACNNLECAWSISRNFYQTMAVNNPGTRSRLHQLWNTVNRVMEYRFTQPALYRAMKELGTDTTNLNAWQQKFVQTHLWRGFLNGLDLTAKERVEFDNYRRGREESLKRYRKNVAKDSGNFYHTITSPFDLMKAPEHVLKLLAVDHQQFARGPWRVTLDPIVYEYFLKYCSNGARRWNVWHRCNSRAGPNLPDSFSSNDSIVGEIVLSRGKEAVILGYDNYFEVAMKLKICDEGFENVYAYSALMFPKLKAMFDEEVKRLQNFATLEFGIKRIQAFDVDFLIQRQASAMFNVNQDEVKQHFPFDVVWQGILDLCREFFDLTFQDKTSSSSLWYPEMRQYSVVTSAGALVGHLIVDPFHRKNKVPTFWVDCTQHRSTLSNQVPVVHFNMSVWPAETPKEVALLSLDELQLMFWQVGTMLAHFLTQSPYAVGVGPNNVEWDCGQMVNYWTKQLLYQPEVLQRLSGGVISDVRARELIQYMNHMKSYKLLQLMYMSELQFDLFVTDLSWRQLQERLWPKYFSPIPLDNDYFMPCSYEELFDQHSGAFYCKIWAEVLATDVMAAFQDAGFDKPDKIKEVAQRFHSTLLALRGGHPHRELFRQFRGRDPSPEAMCNFYGLDGAQ